MIIANLISLLRHKLYYSLGWIRASSKGVRLGGGARVSPRAKIDGVAYIGNAVIGADVTLGRGTYINSGCVHSGTIGKFCSIAYNVTIGPTEHRTDYWTTSPYEVASINGDSNMTSSCAAPPIVSDGVWIGAHAIILRGVKIGARSIIAAGAVVTNDVPPGEIWGGIPARRIRRLTQFEAQQQIDNPTHVSELTHV